MRTRRSIPRLAALFAGLILATGACAQDRSFVATIDHPATVPIVRSTAPLNGDRRYLELTVSGFTPAPLGPVQIVVEVSGPGGPIEIGRVGLYPELAFAVSEPDKAQRFALPLPADLDLGDDRRLTVRLAPGRGDGNGASVEIARAELR